MKKKPEDVIKEAIAEYKQRLITSSDAVIEGAVFEAIKPLTGPVKVGIEAFEFIVACLKSAFPDAGYEKWNKGTPAYNKMVDQIERYWSDHTGSGL